MEKVPLLYQKVHEFLLAKGGLYPNKEFQRLCGVVYKIKKENSHSILEEMERYGLVEFNHKSKKIKVLPKNSG